MIFFNQDKHEDVRYTCDECDYVATRQPNLNIHKRSKHKGIRYPCDQCDYLATQKGHLKIHTKRKQEGQLCAITIAKGKKVKVMKQTL